MARRRRLLSALAKPFRARDSAQEVAPPAGRAPAAARPPAAGGDPALVTSVPPPPLADAARADAARARVADILGHAERLRPLVHRRALDLGSEDRSIVETLSDQFRECDRIEIAETPAPAPTGQGAGERERRGEAAVPPSGQLPFPDETFDFVYCPGVLDRFDRPVSDRWVAEALRVLRLLGVAVLEGSGAAAAQPAEAAGSQPPGAAAAAESAGAAAAAQSAGVLRDDPDATFAAQPDQTPSAPAFGPWPAPFLPDLAFRARISASERLELDPGQPGQLRVTVTNASAYTWPVTPLHELTLAASWAGEDAAPRPAGEVALPGSLVAGQSIELVLTIEPPSDPDARMVELDVIAGGTSFARRGSGPTRIPVTLPSASGPLAGDALTELIARHDCVLLDISQDSSGGGSTRYFVGK